MNISVTNQDPSNFVLPGRIDRLVAVAAKYFTKHGQENVARLLTNGRTEIVEGYDYDNWNGGQYGHGVRILLDEQLYSFAGDEIEKYCTEVRDYLNKISHVDDEHISYVRFVIDIDSVPADWRTQSNLLLSPPSLATADEFELLQLWGGASPRAFLSHKATYKSETKAFKERLQAYGIAGFVAHEDIVPTKPWQTEIERALGSMDVMIALLSEGFTESPWTNQEIGVALGRGVPIVTVRVDEDPPGFSAQQQAVSGKNQDPEMLARTVLSILCADGRVSSLILDALVKRWENAQNYSEGIRLLYALQRLSSIPPDFVARVEEAYLMNDQLHGSSVVKQHLPNLLESLRGGG